MYETVTGIAFNPEIDVPSYHTLRLILVHGNSDDGAKKGRRRAKMTDEEKSLEQAMMATLMETASPGWRDSSNAKKKKNPSQQERGVQVRDAPSIPCIAHIAPTLSPGYLFTKLVPSRRIHVFGHRDC